jgi:hypothetical protein
MRLTDKIPTPKAVEILMRSVLDSEKSVEDRIEDATYLTVIQSRIDKVLNNFQQEYEEYVVLMMKKQEDRMKYENSPDSRYSFRS